MRQRRLHHQTPRDVVSARHVMSSKVTYMYEQALLIIEVFFPLP